MIEQTKVSFDSGGVTCIGYLYHPTQLSATRPCVVLGTGFTGTQDTPSIRAAELKRYPFAHFDFYRPDIRRQVLDDQIDFLRKHLMVNSQ